MSRETISKKIMFSFVHLQLIRWICRTLPIVLFVFTTVLPIFAQTIAVTVPNGGENWEVGSTQTITWTSTGTVGKVKIEYSTDNGGSWKNVKASTDNTGSYSWNIPDDPSTNCLVKVSEKDGDPSDTSDNKFTIATPPAITVTAPDGGENWEVGSTQTITWTSTGAVSNVKIEYSPDNGGTWQEIIGSTSNTGSYSWIIPDDPADECLVKVSETDGDPSDTSDGVFTIATPPTITVTAPNGGESWEVGSTQTITWTSAGAVGKVKIEYSTDDGSSWKNIKASANNTGSYSWTIPDDPSMNSLIRISETDGDPSDTSDGVFTIATPPTITVTAPNGGENWEVGSIQTITWTSEGAVENVKIEYSTNNGSIWTVIEASISSAAGSYDWEIANNPSENCLVRISETDGDPSDTSDAVFTIATPPTITVTAPNGGEIWEVGSTQTITWTSAGAVGKVKIEYSTDDGSSWKNIKASANNTGSYSWTIPDDPSMNSLIRISETDGDPSDTSDAVFTIAIPPTITVNAPNGGENWEVGSTQTITWTSTGTVGDVKIEYSTDNGGSWLEVIASTSNTGSYLWLVPDDPSGECLVKISEADGDPSDASDAVFTIATPPTITVTTPNGDEIWEVGSTQTITWTTTGTLGKVKIEYSTDEGSSWKNIKASANNTGSYSWTIPDDPSTECLVKVSETDGDPSDASNATFSIVSPSSITVQKPNGGENWEVGSTQKIKWKTTGTVGNVTIKYSTSGGANWTEIVDSIAADTGSYDWEVPDTPSDLCLVSISEIGDGLSDTSDATFSIITIMGQLNVVINPQEAINAGAQWRLTIGENWHNSGVTFSYSPSDDYILEFKAISGWSKPPDKSIKIKAGKTTYESGTYEKIYFVTNKDSVKVPEGGTADFKVKLSAKPPADFNVSLSLTGDSDISIQSESSLIFTVANWNKFQTVTLAAIEDEDVIDGEAIIQIRAAGIEDKDITAVEDDNDIADISLKLNPHTGTTGNIIKISIEISNNTQVIDAFGLDFIYDSTLFTIKSIKKGSLTSDWSIIGEEETSPGTITIGGAAGGGQSIEKRSKGTLVRIWLKVKCGSFTADTESEIWIESYADDIEGFSPKPCTANITLVSCPRVGDVNGDGDVTPGDAQNTLEIYLGKRVPEFCQKTTSDSNGDESTTPGDAQDIFECYLGRRELPECHDDGSTGTSSATSFASLRRARDKKRLRPSKPKLYPLNTIGYSGKIVNIPIIITNPEGISSFSFEVNYLPELLEYTGISRSQLTNEFDYVRGIEEIEGLIRVEGESKQPIKYNKYASLAVLAFRVKEGVNCTLPIIVYNSGKDLFNVEIDDGTFLGLEYFNEHERFLSLGKATIMSDRKLRIPVKVSSAFNIKSFGLELKYPSDKMLFAGVSRGELTKDFTAVEGNESEPGVVRVGGYNMSGIQARKPGILVELVFSIKEMDGKIEIIKLVDDIQYFIIQKRRIRINEKKDREKKLWFQKSYDHR